MEEARRAATFSSSPASKLLVVATALVWAVLLTTGCAKVRAWIDPNVLTANYSLFSVAISPDNKYVAAGGILSGQVTVWDLKTHVVKAILKPGGQAEALAFSPDGKYLAAGIGAPYWKLGIAVWDTASWTKLERFELPKVKGRNTSVSHSISFSPDGHYLAAANKSEKNGGVDIWELETGKLYRTLPCTMSYVRAIAYSSDGKYVAAGGIMGDSIEIWSVEHGSMKRLLTTGTGGNVEAIRYDLNDGYLIVGFNRDIRGPIGNKYATLRSWALDSGGLLFEVPCHDTEPLRALDYSPRTKLAAAVGPWGTVRLFDAQTGRLVKELKDHPFPFLEGVCFSSDGKLLAACGGKYIQVWKTSQ